MFGGIYYGAMYGGSTTSILLNTPGEVGLDRHRHRRQHDGAQGPRRAGAGDGRDRLVRRRHDRHAGLELRRTPAGQARLAVRPGRIFRPDGAGPDHGHGRARRQPRRAAWPACSSAWRWGWSASTCRPARRASPWASWSCSTASTPSSSPSACSRSARRSTRRARHKFEKEEIYGLVGSIWMSAEDWGRSWKPWLRGTLLGFPIGALPAGGSEIPTFLSYLIEKRLAKNPEEFGKGAIEAVAGPEAANNAAVAGTLAPLLSLGLPTSATAAILLAAFQQYGLQPGPLLFESSPDLVWGLIASLYIGNVLLLVLNLPMAGHLGEAAAHPQAVALRRHPRLRHHGRLHAEQQRGRPHHPVGHRHPGLRHAGAGRAGRALRGRPDPRAFGRAAVPPCAVDQPGRSVGVLHPPDLAAALGHRGPAGDHADPAAPSPASRAVPSGAA